jgi:hypothetical protein
MKSMIAVAVLPVLLPPMRTVMGEVELVSLSNWKDGINEVKSTLYLMLIVAILFANCYKVVDYDVEVE